MRSIKEPKIIIAWRYNDDDHVKYAKALKELGVMDDYEILPNDEGILLLSYKDRLVITSRDIADMFKLTLGFVPEELIEETWYETFSDVRRGQIIKYTKDKVVIESSK